jgi:carbonic anhydrase
LTSHARCNSLHGRHAWATLHCSRKLSSAAVVTQGLKYFAEGETAGDSGAENGSPVASQAQTAASMSDDPIIQHVLKANESFSQGFDKPMGLGVKKKLTVLTCMDSRLIPERFLGLDIGDAEIIRNGGGRVTLDVLRSMVICQDLLDCTHMLVIHHTDCGGQAALRRKPEWQKKLTQRISKHSSLPMQALFFSVWWASYITPPFIRRAIEYLLVRPIPDLVDSVVEDVKLLRNAPNIDPSLKIYGLLYSTDTGRLTELCRDEGGGLTVTDAYRQAKQANGAYHPPKAGSKGQKQGEGGGHHHSHSNKQSTKSETASMKSDKGSDKGDKGS